MKMRRPPGTSPILWWIAGIMWPFLAAYGYLWSKCTKEGRAEERMWRQLDEDAKSGKLREAFLAQSRPIPEGPPTKDMLWILDDEPTRGRELRQRDAEEAALRANQKT